MHVVKANLTLIKCVQFQIPIACVVFSSKQCTLVDTESKADTMALLANAHVQGCLTRHHCANPRPFTAVQQPVRRASRHTCTCSARPRPETFDRRDAMLSMAAAAAVLNVQPAQADGGKHRNITAFRLWSNNFLRFKRSSCAETKTLYGKASPPTSYGGYGGNAKEGAK